VLYVMAIRCSDTLTMPAGEQRADELIAAVTAPGWQRISAGAGAHGPREYDWARVPVRDVRVMRNQRGYISGCNGQLVVTSQQVIVGAMLSQHPVDRTLLYPVLDQMKQFCAPQRLQSPSSRL
jgi:hypothetical protein